MSELSPSTRALLDAARAGMTPSADAVKRMRANVAASAAAGATAAGITGLAVKLTVIGAVVVGAIGALALRGSGPQVSAPEISLPEVARGTPASVVQYSQVPQPAPVATAKPIEPQPRSRAAPRSRRAPEIDLARESSLIRAADTALRSGKPAAALSAIHVYKQETRGRGQLAEDAAAIEIEAYCLVHNPRVRALLDAFDRRFPRSAQRSRLTTACH
ncbi:MAG: hypothetical protein AB7P03_00755 [Kofleriaceae bacterium]